MKTGIKEKRRRTILFVMVLIALFGLRALAADVCHLTAKKQTFKIDSGMKGKWTVSSSEEWIEVKKNSAGTKVIVTVLENKGKKRSGYFAICNKKKTNEIRVTVEQAASDSTLDRFSYDWLAGAAKQPKNDVTMKFLKKAVKVADKLGVTPDDLMSVMAFESGLNHKAVNPRSGATGLIQFMSFTASSLGTSQGALKKMSAVKQMNFVYRYLQNMANSRGNGKLKDLGDLYMAILWPTGVGHKDSYVLWHAGSVQYSGNSGLDVNNDGKITRKECLSMVLGARKRFVGV